MIPQLLAIVLGVGGVIALRASLADDAHAVHVREDVVLLPAPQETKLLSLGHHAAAVDILWGKTLVEYGIHVSEKRPFDIERYLDTVLELEPDYWPLYKYVDTLVVYRPPIGTEADARTARAYLERGTRERPHDYRVWLQYGQFMSYLARSFVQDDAEIAEWQRLGALALAHAVELGADADNSLSATTALAKYGANDAAIAHLQRAYDLTDDPETRRQILYKLERLQGEEIRRELALGSAYVDRRRMQDAPSLPPRVYGWLGPFRDPARCVDWRAPGCEGTLAEARERQPATRSGR